MNRRLDFLRRKNKGKQKIQAYNKILLGSGIDIATQEYIDLEHSDEIIEQVKELFTQSSKESELLEEGSLFFDSHILRRIYLNLGDSDTCYIYTDDFEYCGMYKIKSKLGLERALDVAANDFQNTCYLLDVEMQYSLTINYYDENHSDDPNTFDIQLKVNSHR